MFNLARQYASAVLGGIGLVSTFLGLFVATLFPNGLEISGITAWVLSALVVWLITALGTWILGALIIKRWWERAGRAGARVLELPGIGCPLSTASTIRR